MFSNIWSNSDRPQQLAAPAFLCNTKGVTATFSVGRTQGRFPQGGETLMAKQIRKGYHTEAFYTEDIREKDTLTSLHWRDKRHQEFDSERKDKTSIPGAPGGPRQENDKKRSVRN